MLPAAVLRLPAPAKLNLFLHVTGRRPDGLHTLESLFVLVDFADTITLACRDDGHVARTHDVPGVPADDDLAVRAARLLQRESGTAAGVDVTLDKRLPMGAGLGGGSSDAATVLLGLNRLWRLDWPRARLQALAVRLGADVPFFLQGEAALARGIGEVLAPVTVPPAWIALLVPDAHVATASIFAAAELTRSSPQAKMDVFSERYGRNDLEAVARLRHPAIAEAITALSQHSQGARMTGSGACAFALAATHAEAQRVLECATRAAPGARGHVARMLSRHPLAGFAA